MKFETKISWVVTHRLNKNLHSERSDQAPLRCKSLNASDSYPEDTRLSSVSKLASKDMSCKLTASCIKYKPSCDMSCRGTWLLLSYQRHNSNLSLRYVLEHNLRRDFTFVAPCLHILRYFYFQDISCMQGTVQLDN